MREMEVKMENEEEKVKRIYGLIVRELKSLRSNRKLSNFFLC